VWDEEGMVSEEREKEWGKGGGGVKWNKCVEKK